MSNQSPAAADVVSLRIDSTSVEPDAKLCSRPDTVLWGYIAANLPPALTIKPGQIVEIEALSHQGLTTTKDPEKYFAGYGIPVQEVLPDAKAVFAEVPRPKGASVHILTGPIYIEGAEPGDTVEVRVLDIKFRVPYGINNTGPGKGLLPHLLNEPVARLIRLDLERRVALFSEDIEIPLNPFMGIMAVSPPTSLGMVSSTPPGAWGGNIDLKFTGIGSSLYLPVFNKGAQFFGIGSSLATSRIFESPSAESSSVSETLLEKGRSWRLRR